MITEATRPAARRGDTPGAPATSVALVATAASPGAEALEALRDLPGLLHGCLLDENGGRVLAEVGTDEGTAAAVLAWGRRAGGVATDRGLALEDVIITSDAAHHLLRAVDGAPSRGAWVYLRVDRDRGNLALARRRLAAAAAPAGPSLRAAPPVTEPPAPRSTPRPLSLPTPPPATTPALPAAAAPATTPAAVPPAVPAPAPARPARSVPPMAGTFPRRVPERSPAAAATAAPLSAPIAAMAAPPTSAPAAQPAPPALPEPRRPTGTASTTRPAGPVPPADVEHRRSPPQDSAGVLTQRWRTDPETLRRVLAGLLRLGRGSPSAAAPPPGPPPALPGR